MCKVVKTQSKYIFKLFIDCKQIFDGSVFKNLLENYAVYYFVIWYYSCIEHITKRPFTGS